MPSNDVCTITVDVHVTRAFWLALALVKAWVWMTMRALDVFNWLLPKLVKVEVSK